MKLISQIKQRVNEQFNNAQLPETGSKAPRAGYYYIKSVGFETVGPLGQVLIAQAIWKKNLQDYFVEELVITVAVSNLMFDSADHPPLLDNLELVGKTLYVHQPVFDVKHFNGVPQKIVKAMCHYVNEPAKFINESNAAIMSLFENGANGNVAYQQLLEKSPYNLEASLNNEADFGYKHDALVNEYAFADDIYDEDPFENISLDAPDADDSENEADL